MFDPGFAVPAVIAFMVIIIVALKTFGGIMKARYEAKKNEPDVFLEDFERRFERLEDRVANIETIVLEKEKDRKFANL